MSASRSPQRPAFQPGVPKPTLPGRPQAHFVQGMPAVPRPAKNTRTPGDPQWSAAWDANDSDYSAEDDGDQNDTAY